MEQQNPVPWVTAACAGAGCEDWGYRGPEDAAAPVIEDHEAVHGIWEQTRGSTPVTVIRDIPGESERERAGRIVREVWVQDARERGDTKPAHLVPWPELNAQDRRIDERIGQVLSADVRARDAEACRPQEADRDAQ